MWNAFCFCGKHYLIPKAPQDVKDLQAEDYFSLRINDIDVGVYYYAELCPDCTRKKNQDFLFQIISVEAGQVKVNWEKYLLKIKTFAHKWRHYLDSVLVKLGIFSVNASGNWIVMSEVAGCLNPEMDSAINLYFTDPDDSLAFADAAERLYNHGHSQIMRIDQVHRV